MYTNILQNKNLSLQLKSTYLPKKILSFEIFDVKLNSFSILPFAYIICEDYQLLLFALRRFSLCIVCVCGVCKCYYNIPPCDKSNLH